MSSLWPYDANSQSPPKQGIIWFDAAKGFENAHPKVWRAISKHDASVLSEDARFVNLFELLSPEVKEIVLAKAAGRTEVQIEKPRVKGKNEKEDLLSEIERVLKDAESAGDLTARLKSIELRAKLHSLLSQKTPEDERTITINVTTGVPRG